MSRPATLPAQKSGIRCAIGGGRMSPELAYCVGRDTIACAACLVRTVEAKHGPDAPTVRHLRGLYPEGVPGCDGSRP